MRENRFLITVIFVLIAVVVLLLFALLTRHNHITAVVDPNGHVRQYAKPGDILEWKTYNSVGPNYTVSFPNNNGPCGPMRPLQVTGTQSQTCTVVTPPGDAVYSYNIDPPSPSNGNQPVHIPFNVKPCQGCGTINVPGSSSDSATGSTAKTITPMKGDSTTPAEISCPIPTDPASFSVNTLPPGGTIWWENQPINTWTLTFTGETPCKTDGKSFSNNGYIECDVDSTASGPYAYKLTAYGCADNNNGSLTITPAQPAPTPK